MDPAPVSRCEHSGHGIFSCRCPSLTELTHRLQRRLPCIPDPLQGVHLTQATISFLPLHFLHTGSAGGLYFPIFFRKAVFTSRICCGNPDKSKVVVCSRPSRVNRNANFLAFANLANVFSGLSQKRAHVLSDPTQTAVMGGVSSERRVISTRA